jgi:ribosomal protein L37E
MNQFNSVNAYDGLVTCEDCGELVILGVTGNCPHCGYDQEEDSWENDPTEEYWEEYDKYHDGLSNYY